MAASPLHFKIQISQPTTYQHTRWPPTADNSSMQDIRSVMDHNFTTSQLDDAILKLKFDLIQFYALPSIGGSFHVLIEICISFRWGFNVVNMS